MGRITRYREWKHYSRYFTRYLWERHIQRCNTKKLVPTRWNAEYMKSKFGIEVHEPYKTIQEKYYRRPKNLRLVKDLKIEEKEENFWRYDKYLNVPKSEQPRVDVPYKSCFLYDGSSPLAEGIFHALNISKAVYRKGLPDTLMSKVENVKLDDGEETLNRLIMQSQSWDPSIEKLPKRRDPVLWWRTWPRYFGIPQARRNSILMENLFRYTLTLSGQFPSLKNLRYFKSGEVNGFTERNNELLRVFLTSHTTISSPQPLSPVVKDGDNTVDEQLPDIHPIKSTVDLRKENLLDDSNKQENVFPLMWADKQLTPQTLLITKEDIHQHYPWTVKEIGGNAVMAAFGTALSVAKRKYPDVQSVLPESLVTQCIQVHDGLLDFVVFQLNTLDLNNDQGVKNIAWVDEGNKFFSIPPFWQDFKNVEDFEPTVFNKFLAVMLNCA